MSCCLQLFALVAIAIAGGKIAAQGLAALPHWHKQLGKPRSPATGLIPREGSEQHSTVFFSIGRASTLAQATWEAKIALPLVRLLERALISIELYFGPLVVLSHWHKQLGKPNSSGTVLRLLEDRA